MPPVRTTKKPSTAKLSTNPLDHPTLRTTATHIFFHGGLLSQWHPCPTPFTGATALSYTLPKLVALNIPHPPATAVSTRLIRVFPFNRGEQWMMALKAWLFERSPDSLAESEAPLTDAELQSLKTEMLRPTSPSEPARKELWESTMCAIMRSNVPRVQKALGRRAKGFREEVWREACMPVVVGGCVARASVDSALKRVYLAAEQRTFVEGSPRDRIWGVGLKWDSSAIEDEKNWKGMNRLGVCHGMAAEVVRQGQ
ncbi:hypothetical protein BDV59DRAFT_186703 [Aspergillus ambiguus]|uniref:uncharacterized protein n=1 Tax=Aspergillus ambiguus TaxID=176160 RepID=UPI003CCD4E72